MRHYEYKRMNNYTFFFYRDNNINNGFVISIKISLSFHLYNIHEYNDDQNN